MARVNLTFIAKWIFTPLVLLSALVSLVAFPSYSLSPLEATKAQADTATSSPITLDALISLKSDQYGVPTSTLNYIVIHESNGSTTVQSNYYDKDGRRENSWGCVQINLDWHPEITKAEALDCEFSIDFLASNISQGKGYLWTTYRKLKGI